MKIWHGLILGLMINSFALAEDVHWTYHGSESPEHWGKLKPEFAICETGKNQTPINMVEATMIEAELPALAFDYKNAAASVVNNGHTIQVNYPAGSSFSIDGKTFHLAQFHFHTPSENQINGKAYPLELHLVHKTDKGELAVIAVVFNIGEANTLLADIWSKVAAKENEEVKLEQPLNLMKLLPENKDYFRFNGSLTTPPCSEGVRWFVMKQPLTVSQAQIDQFKTWMKHENARPIQAVNARPILK